MDWSWAFPPRCVCCTRRLQYRDTCRLIAAACIRCQPQLTPCQLSIPELDRVFSLLSYQENAAFLIKQGKYAPHAPLLKQLGGLLAAHYSRLPSTGIDAVLAAPSHPKLLRRRGLNPARLLAAPLALTLKVPLLEPYQRSSARLPQAQLPLQKRKRRANKVIRCTMALPEIVLIVDDVVTSGSTLQTLAALARAAGAKQVLAAVICNASRAPLDGE